jgi:hypothetical protein
MLHLSVSQIDELERRFLAERKAEIILWIQNEFSSEADCLGHTSLAQFVQQIMNACRAVWIDQLQLIYRVVKIAFILEYVQPDTTHQRLLVRVLTLEETPEARVRFAEENILDKLYESMSKSK